MMHKVATALAAGVTAALLFVLVTQGTLFALLLAFFALLPVIIATLGWGHVTGLAASLIGAAAIGMVINGKVAVAFLCLVGLPAWWLGYLALLARPAADGAAAVWYPVSQLVAWMAGLSIAGTFAAVLGVSTSYAGYEAAVDTLAHTFGPLLDNVIGGGANLPEGFTSEALARDLIEAMPVGSAASTALLLALNLWLAARIVQASHRLARPWPAIADSLRLPRWLAGVLAIALVLAFADGFLGLFARIAAAAVGMVFAFEGLAVLHVRTRPLDVRAPILFGVYALIVLLTWPLVFFVIAGVVDCLHPLRGRRLGAPGTQP